MSRRRFTFWLDDTKNEENELIGQVDTLKQNRSFSKTIRDGIRLVTSLTSGSLDVLFELFPFVRAEFLEYVQEKISDNSSAENDQLQQRIIQLEAENATLKERARILEEEIEEDNEIIDAQDKELAILRKQKDSPAPGNIQAQLDRIEQQLLAQGNQPINSVHDAPQTPKSSGIGLKGLSGNSGGVGLKGGGLGSTISVPPPTFDDDDDMPELTITKAKSDGQANKNFLKSMMALQGD